MRLVKIKEVVLSDRKAGRKESKMIEFVIEKVANMVFISSGEHIWRAWDETEVTERKINNAINRISKEHCGNIKVINRL